MKKKVVSASDIGRVAYCPHASYLSTIHHHSNSTKKLLSYGDKQHEIATKKAIKEDKRCFIASYALGENHGATRSLRRFRDDCLLPFVLGRCFIRAYYFLSPKIITAFGSSSLFKACSVRVVLLCERIISKRTGC